MKPGQDTYPPFSHLFTVRVWREELAENQHEWRGRVQHIITGEAYYFRGWPEMVSLLAIWLEKG